LIAKLNRWGRGLGRISSSELYYQELFNNGVRRLDIPPLFPTKAAANHSLLYLILRVCTEAGINRALDVGAGQSSLLFSSLPVETITIETDRDWAARIQERVEHPVLNAELRTKNVAGRGDWL